MNMSMEAVKVCCLVCIAVHEEVVVFSNIFIFVPFGVGSKKPAFIDVFTEIQSFKFCFERKNDWNIFLHPLIVYVSKLGCGICCGEDTIMINFKNRSTKKLAASCLLL